MKKPKRLSLADLLALGLGLTEGGVSLKRQDEGRAGEDDDFGLRMITAGAALTHLAARDTPQRRGAAAEALQLLSEDFATLAARLAGDLA